MLSDALMEPTTDYKRPHNTKIIMSKGKVFIPSMCKVSATMKVSRFSAKAELSTVLQQKFKQI